jgi:putative phosphoribosyl transferase
MRFDEPLLADRQEAGRLLARQLEPYRQPGLLVLGIPRGGVPVAAEVAESLQAELDVIVARKLGAPGQAELAIGAVAADGERYLNTTLIGELGVSETYVNAVTATQSKEARRREQWLRESRPAAPITGRTVVLIDDGLATGATMLAAIRSVRRRNPAKVVVAVPVGAEDTCAALRSEVDAVVCPNELSTMVAIGFYYADFRPVDDAAVRRLLQRAVRYPPEAQTVQAGHSPTELVTRR